MDPVKLEIDPKDQEEIATKVLMYAALMHAKSINDPSSYDENGEQIKFTMPDIGLFSVAMFSILAFYIENNMYKYEQLGPMLETLNSNISRLAASFEKAKDNIKI